MRILVVHNAYQRRGGEDAVVGQEVNLLRDAGHDVFLEHVTNDTIVGPMAKAKAFFKSPHDPDRAEWISNLVRQLRVDVVHIHNFFPLLTPAIHEGAALAGAAVVQTLHNYRAVCASAMLLRDGKVCEKCLTGSRYWGAIHRCYRGSLPASLALVRMQTRADRKETWSRHVHRFIALTEFSRQKFIAGGFPQSRIVVKPNFVATPAVAIGDERSGALFVGRLSPEKGAATLVRAWRRLPNLPLSIIGGGPEASALRAAAPSNVSFLGELSPVEVAAEMRRASVLVVPSIWFEPFGMVVVEAFSLGLPVVASNIGSLGSLVRPGHNGALFTPGDAEELADNLMQLVQQPDLLAALGRGALADYTSLYTPKQNLAQLEAIYSDAIAEAEAMF